MPANTRCSALATPSSLLGIYTALGTGIGVSLLSCGGQPQKADTAKHPNVIVILADDLGYGDISGYGATAIHTPNIDRLVQQGLRFTNGYATSATSTPSRFALMTGMYPWRNKEAHILSGDAPLIIGADEETLPGMFRQAGYATGVVGKWHLGLGDGTIDWNGHIAPGPCETGFDYCFIMAATNDRVPCIYVENHSVVHLDKNDPIEVSYLHNFEGEPTGKSHPERLKIHPSDNQHDMSIINGISRIGFMKGGKAAQWVDETMAEVFLDKAKGFIDKQKDHPFFLYYCLHQPHAPRVPNEQFAGRSALGVRGDVILEADWCVGQLLDLLEEKGILENTIVIFTSDNGPVATEGYYDDGMDKLGDHRPAGPFRGGKYSLFEGGTHIPFIVQWPGVITPGVSDAMICQMDFFNSFSTLTGQPVNLQKDSRDLMKVLLGQSEKGRENLVQEAMGKLAFRQGDWAYIPSYAGGTQIANNDTGNSPSEQLYYLKSDIGEQENLAFSEPAQLEEMKNRFSQIIK